MPLPGWHKFCHGCGSENKFCQPQAALALEPGRRVGFKRKRPDANSFQIDALVKNHFQGLKATTEVGAACLGVLQDDIAAAGTPAPAAGSSDDSDSESSEKSVYDPPVYVAAQLGTVAAIRSALKAVLSDVSDPKHKTALVFWAAEHLRTLWAASPEKKVSKQALGEYVKVVIDGLAAKTPAKRLKWFNEKVERMKSGKGGKK